MNDPSSDLELVILPRVRDLGEGFEVHRVLPYAQHRMVGPFVFFDQMGPVALAPERGLDVRPHPHIGLATVTYLFEGEILHRDSLGTVQAIRPGDVNWMTAGRGIAHSERTPLELRHAGSRIFGIQLWVALPERDEETEPSFAHHPAAALPVVAGDGKEVRIILGELYGERSPVRTFSPTVYAEVALAPRARLAFPAEHEERAAFVASGTVAFAGTDHPQGRLLVFRSGNEVVLEAAEGARVLLLGGAALEGPRHIWWNFVSSRKERIEQAKADWRQGRFAQVIGESEFIPLPE